MKKILFGNEAREKLVAGVNKLADAVGSTLGPKANNVAIGNDFGFPNVVHDGVTVARSIDLEDPYEDMGAQLVKGAAQRTNDVAGDGTTTATILAQSIVNQGMEAIKRGANAMVLNKEINASVDKVIANLKEMAVPVTKEDYKKVATISAQSESIGAIVAEAIKKVGADGVVDVQEGSDFETSIEIKDGMEFDRGYSSPYFLTNTDTLEAVVTDPYILLLDFKVYSATELMPFLEKFIQTSKNLVIISEAIEGEALRLLIKNKLGGANLNVLCVKAPGFGERRKDWLNDIAFLTGARVIASDTGEALKNVEISDLGKAKKVVSTKDKTKIVDGMGNKKDLAKRIKVVQLELKKTKEAFKRHEIKQRLAKLTGGIAVITAGASSEVEMGEIKERIIDAVNATQSAIEEGVVVGGEMALYYASDCDSLIVQKACTEPWKRLVENSGYDLRQVVKGFDDLDSSRQLGFNVMTGEWGDILMEGVIDPVKVTINALKNAASVATMILTTNTLVVPVKEPNEKA